MRERTQVENVAKVRPDIIRIGCFGSYARGDWGVGSDLNLVIILQNPERVFEVRSTEWDTTRLPVPADVLITEVEWEHMGQSRQRRDRSPLKEVVWVYQ